MANAKGKKKRPPRGAASPTSPQRLRAAERQRHALDLRMGGASYDQIAESLGYTNRGGAHKAVMAGLAVPAELVEGVRELELRRLDRLWLTVWEAAIRGEREAIAICIQLMKRRADFEGLDKAKMIRHSGPDGDESVHGEAFDVFLEVLTKGVKDNPAAQAAIAKACEVFTEPQGRNAA